MKPVTLYKFFINTLRFSLFSCIGVKVVRFPCLATYSCSVQQLVNAVDYACARSEVTCNMKRSAAISQQYLLDCIMTAISK